MSADLLPTVEVEPGRPAEAAVVLLHGLGADGHDFEGVVPALRLPERPAIRWVFPHAPVRPVTINGGYRMRAWFDITGLHRAARQDLPGIRAAAEAVDALVRRERERGVPSDRLVLAGFSQGGALALHVGLRRPERLAGILALSTYLPMQSSLAAERHPANAAVPVLMAHGTDDPVVGLSLATHSRDHLLSLGYAVEWRSYPMGHQVSPEELADVREWLLRVLS
jgi:phospholipase/carboxylesterase